MSEPDAEIQFTELVEHVFGGPPRPEKSIILQLSEDSLLEFGTGEFPDQEFFLDLAAAGVQRLFRTTNLFSVTEDQFRTLLRYMNSVGVTIEVKVENPDGTTSKPFLEDPLEGARLSMRVRWL